MYRSPVYPKRILYHDYLVRLVYVGGKHTDIENLKKGLPGHVKDAAKELVKEGILILKPTSYGLHVSLNPQMRKEIDLYLQ